MSASGITIEPAAAGGALESKRGNGIPDSRGDQLFPSAERHDSVAAAGDLSDPEEQFSSGFREGRADYSDYAADRVFAAAFDRALYRPQAEAVFPAVRDGIHAGGAGVAVDGFELRVHSDCGGADRDGVGRVSSGIVAGGADGFGRPAWTGAIGVSGGGKCGVVARAAAGRVHRSAARTAQHRVVHAGGAAGDCPADQRGRVVQAPRGSGAFGAGQEGADSSGAVVAAELRFRWAC